MNSIDLYKCTPSSESIKVYNLLKDQSATLAPPMVVWVSIVVLIGSVGVVVALVIGVGSVEIASIIFVMPVFVILVLLEVIPPHVIFSFTILLIVIVAIWLYFLNLKTSHNSVEKCSKLMLTYG